MKRAAFLFLLVPLAATPVACGGSDDASSGGTAGAAGTGGSSAGAAGMAGGAGAAGGEPEDKCTATGVYKGPWVVAPDTDGIKVRWQTCVPNAKTVSFALDGVGEAGSTAEATETKYDLTVTRKSIFPDIPADYAGTYYFYEAKLTGLKSGCYSYSVAGDATKKGRFCTARPAGQPYSFLAVGDTSPKVGGIEALSVVLPKNPDFTLHGGDIQYYASTETWQYWFEKMQPLLSQGAFEPARGNHESEDQNPEEYDQYFRRFFGTAGFEGSGDHFEFQSGGVWYFSVDTQEAFDAASDQGKWLVQRLEHAKAQPGFRYSVIFQHRPYFTCGDSDHHPTEQASLEPAMKANGVKLVLQAHMHGYERFLVNGITYVTTGGGGALMGVVSENLDRPECKDRQVFGNVPHAVLFDVTASGLTGTVYDAKGGVLDKFDL